MEELIFFKMHNDKEHLYNMHGDYTYLTEGYYKSLDSELSGMKIRPTTEEALDAYVVPLAVKKAELSNLKTPDYQIVTEKIVPPVLAYPINPFSSKCEIIIEKEDVEKKLRTLTMNGKYAVICQTLPSDYRIDVIRCILGVSLEEDYKEFTAAVFKTFNIPLMRIRAIVTANEYLFSAIEPLPYNELSLKEKKLIEELGTWQR